MDTQGNVYVADQLSYVVQKFTAAGVFEAEWGSYGGGHGQFGPIGGLATDAAGNVYVVDSSHNRIEKFDPNGNFITAWGHAGSELGQFHFFSSQNPTQPPGGGIAVGGNFVYVADSGNNRIERFNLEGGEAMQWGSLGDGPGQFHYPRGVAANASEVLVTDDDNHRIEKFGPEGAFEGAVGSGGTGPGQFGFPYGVSLDAAGEAFVADDINHRVVKLNPALGFVTAWGGFGSKPGQLAFPRGLAADPAGDTYVADTANDRIEVYDPNGNYLRTLGVSARGPGMLTGPDGLGDRPERDACWCPTRSTTACWRSNRERWPTRAPGRRRAGTPPTSAIPRASAWTRAARSISPIQATNASFACGATAPTSQNWAGRPTIGGAQLSGAGSVVVSPATGEIYVADRNHNRVLVYSSAGTVVAKWGGGEGDGASGSGPGEFNHPAAVALDGAGNVYVADTNNNRVVKLNAYGSVLDEWGSRGTGDGRFRDPTGIAVDGAGNVYVVDNENNRVQVFDTDGRFLAKWGAARRRRRRLLPADGGHRGLQRRRVCGRHQQQPRRALQPPKSGFDGLCGGGRLASPAGCRTDREREPAAVRRHPRTPRARPDRQLQARLQDPRDRHALSRRQAGRGQARGARPLAARGAARPRALAPSRRDARPPARRARATQVDDGAGAHRRGRADRPADHRQPHLHRQPLRHARRARHGPGRGEAR